MAVKIESESLALSDNRFWFWNWFLTLLWTTYCPSLHYILTCPHAWTISPNKKDVAHNIDATGYYKQWCLYNKRLKSIKFIIYLASLFLRSFICSFFFFIMDSRFLNGAVWRTFLSSSWKFTNDICKVTCWTCWLDKFNQLVNLHKQPHM